MLSLTAIFILFGTGVLAGISNAIAGGGTFFTFPAFLIMGLSPVVASASNSIAVWPGHILAVIGYRRELLRFSKGMTTSIIIALLGGIVGALLLADIGNNGFSKLIPFLILFATLVFSLGHTLAEQLKKRFTTLSFTQPRPITRILEFVFAIYGGFFGAGLGFILMAGLLMLGVRDIHASNALKNLLGAAVGSVTLVVFSISGLVSWHHTAIVFLGAMVGGFMGVHVAKALPEIWLRRIIMTLGFGLSIYYFVKYYGSF